METITDIPVELDAPALLRRASVAPGGEDAAEFMDLVARAKQVARPKALYREAFIEARGEETVTIDGIGFTSRALRLNLDKVERVFTYITTCGRELDGIGLDPDDFLKRFWLDMIKEAVLRVAIGHLQEYLTRRFALGRTATMNPGSGDATVWPIEQQRPLFALLGDVEAQIGVVLTDTFLMLPNKTVSGIRFPTEVDFRTCQLCHREVCPSRAAPFDAELWESMQHD